MSRKILNLEELAAGRAKAKLSRRWYKKTLLAIFEGTIECTAIQLNALSKFADQQGWVGPKRKVEALKDKSRYKPKPQLSEDLIARLAPNLTAPNTTLQIIAEQAKHASDDRRGLSVPLLDA